MLSFKNRSEIKFKYMYSNSKPIGAPGPCSQFLGESELLIYFCYFVGIILFIICSLLCSFVFYVWFFPWITFFWFPLESWFPWLLCIHRSFVTHDHSRLTVHVHFFSFDCATEVYESNIKLVVSLVFDWHLLMINFLSCPGQMIGTCERLMHLKPSEWPIYTTIPSHFILAVDMALCMYYGSFPFFDYT